MVHALRQAWRVLKADGILIDLRPGPVHRRVRIRGAGHSPVIGTMRERFEDDYAADRAVAEVVRRGFFKIQRRVRFQCNRTMDTLPEFRDWLNDVVTQDGLASHEWLFQKVKRAIVTRGKGKIVVEGPLDLRVLKKLNTGGR